MEDTKNFVSDEEKELLENGWKRETLCIHLDEYDESAPKKFRRLGYDISDDFNSNQIGILKNWANEINKRFPNIKISLSGTGLVPSEEAEASF